MIHRVEGETRVRAAHVEARRSQSARCESLSDKQNNSERLLHDPMLKIKNAKAGEGDEAEKRQHLVTPFHEGDVDARTPRCQRKNRLSIFLIVGKVRSVWRVRSCSSFATAGASIPAVGTKAKKMETQHFSRAHRFTRSSIAIIPARS